MSPGSTACTASDSERSRILRSVKQSERKIACQTVDTGLVLGAKSSERHTEVAELRGGLYSPGSRHRWANFQSSRMRRKAEKHISTTDGTLRQLRGSTKSGRRRLEHIALHVSEALRAVRPSLLELDKQSPSVLARHRTMKRGRTDDTLATLRRDQMLARLHDKDIESTTIISIATCWPAPRPLRPILHRSES